MARIYPLFSSSKGNAIFVGSAKAGVLIDAGVSCKRLGEALDRCGLSFEAVKGIFVTHSHSDHVKGLKVLTGKRRIPIFGQRETLCELVSGNMLDKNAEIYELDGAAYAADMEITCFDTPHDTVRSCGYKISTGDGRTCAVCTDLGHITDEVDKNILGCDLVLLESNYDKKMLLNGPYPSYLKSRILSDNGHLSNDCCAAQAARLIKNGTTRIILGHLSQENNTPKTAEATVLSALGEFVRDRDYILEVAHSETTGEMVVF